MTATFFRLGAETPFVQGIKSEDHPYSVSLNSNIFTLEDADVLLTSAHVKTLKDRVQPNDNNPNVATVDRFFKVKYENGDLQALAVETWSGLFTSCRRIQYVSGTLALGLTLFAFQGPAVYLVVASGVGAVAFACLFGWSLHRYYVAEKELAVWQRPGEDFAKKRLAALQLPLHEMVKNKCYFHPNQTSSTLLGVEMLSVFRRDFKKFATLLLDRKCESPEEQHQWVVNFMQGNPLWIEFFEDNPHLASKPVYHDIWKFQKQIHQLLELLNTLKIILVPEWHKNHDAAKKMSDDIQKKILEKAEAFRNSQKIPVLSANNYVQRILKILKTECLDKINDLGLKEKTQAEFFGSIVYSQVRALLEEAKKGLLEDQPYKLDEGAFECVDIFFTENFQRIINDFQKKLDAITAPYPKNVIDKLKAEAPKEARQEYTNIYLGFIDAAFT